MTVKEERNKTPSLLHHAVALPTLHCDSARQYPEKLCPKTSGELRVEQSGQRVSLHSVPTVCKVLLEQSQTKSINHSGTGQAEQRPTSVLANQHCDTEPPTLPRTYSFKVGKGKVSSRLFWGQTIQESLETLQSCHEVVCKFTNKLPKFRTTSKSSDFNSPNDVYTFPCSKKSSVLELRHV